LKNLDLLNPAMAQPRTFSSTIAILPFLLGLICIPLAFAAAPSMPFQENLLALICAAQSVIALFLMVIPRLFHWDWRAKFFGVSLLYIGSTALLGVIPLLGVVMFSDVAVALRLLLVATYSLSVIVWCRRFVIYYRKVFADTTLRGEIYLEEHDAIYYLQQGDKRQCDKTARIAQFPPNLLFAIFTVLAMCTVPYAGRISNWAGISYINFFLAIAGFPIVLMCLGLGVRGYLIYYYYPWILKRATGKDVYVLMARLSDFTKEQ
jgi:hypothetical protein